MSLEAVPLAIAPLPLPPPLAAYVAAARARQAPLEAVVGRLGTGFITSDYELAYAALVALRTAEPARRRFLEWGAGAGVIAGLAASLGYDASGLEVDRRLCALGRELAAAHQLPLTLVHGSFVPDGYRPRDADVVLEGRTAWDAPDGYDELQRSPDEFDVVYAYPWPGEEAAYRRLFAAVAAPGALLVTFHGADGLRVRRRRLGV